MSALEVILVTKEDCPNCDRVRAALTRARHDYRHLEVTEVDLDEPLGRALAIEQGILMVPALIINGRLRLVGDASEKDIRREIEKARPHSRR